ncbi:MAG TPA: T9SS type A sorting domain-containing protein [Ignavibacteria bacterium]
MKQILLISVLLIILFSSSYSHNYSKDIQINNDDPVNADKIGQLLMDTASAKYLPLAVGNKYIYIVQTIPIPTTSSKMKTTITKDTLISGKRYFYFSNPPLFSSCWMRYDSLTGCAIAYSTNGGCFPYTNDRIVDSLAAKINDQGTGCFFSFYHLRRCNDTSNITLFGNYQTKRKSFYHDGLLVGGSTYARNIGLSYCSALEFDGTSYTLIGCMLNGVVYGDTTLTGITNLNTGIPDKFSLYQNYPNPFNPTTKIKFDIKKEFRNQESEVKLSIYDILGRKIEDLVNEKLQPGSYEITFDGANLPSGIYFYRLTTEGYSDVKKMTLLK